MTKFGVPDLIVCQICSEDMELMLHNEHNNACAYYCKECGSGCVEFATGTRDWFSKGEGRNM
ncbi:MAG: hypothetical protein KAS32_13545 [Candidatus Peribacteraceae bacterium]|nr:hypothetical protein [Candidatus Peribacteraceae bacterium]